jgi:hypothetical protein
LDTISDIWRLRIPYAHNCVHGERVPQRGGVLNTTHLVLINKINKIANKINKVGPHRSVPCTAHRSRYGSIRQQE